jgi:hypothetical protein
MKKIIIITCSSFTAIVLIFALLSEFYIVPELSRAIILQLFAMAFTIALLMFLLETIEYRLDAFSLLTDTLFRVLIGYTVVFLEGGLFGMFPFEWKAFAYISPVLIPAYIITYLISYITCVECANAINQSIKRKR